VSDLEPVSPEPRMPIPGAFAYSVRDVAILCRVAERVVQKATSDGVLRPSYPHSDARYTPDAVREWVDGWPNTPPPPKRS
jgi:hypothetical protein